MATSVVPALIDAIVAQATAALPALRIYDGYGVTDDPGDYLMVGVSDPDSDDEAESATADQEWRGLGKQTREETGDVTCCALSWNGNADQKAARDAAYATCAAVENMLRANPSLGVTGVLWAEFGTSTRLQQNQSGDGAQARVTFQIHFKARI